MKIYVVTFDSCGDRIIEGVFSTSKKANAYINRETRGEEPEVLEYYDIVELILDKPSRVV